MKIIYKTLFFILFLFTFLSQAQDWIKEYPGIPLETGLVWDWVTLPSSGSPGNRGAVDSMKLAGIDIVRLSPSSPGRMDTITNWLGSGFRVLPFASTDQAGNIYNWIQHYTDAKYSIWEAEGTSLGNDDAGLKQKDPSKTEIYTSPSGTTFIRRLGNVTNSIDQLTEGPYYDQDVHYYASQNNKLDTINYNAKFYLMLQNNNPPVAYNSQDTICILSVTYSACEQLNIIDTTITIKDTVLKRIDFDNLDVGDTVSFNYNLAGTIPLSVPSYNPGMQASFIDDKSGPGPRDGRSYIEFKVTWVGKPNSQGKPSYLLSFDKIILSDNRGRELKTTPLAESRIYAQDNQLNSYYDEIAGWIGIDEPVSIDIFEPIRMVKEKIESKTNNRRPLRIPFMGSWSGYWDQANNHFGAQGKSK